jgi:hypothetical protein
MAKDPDERFQSMDELGAELERCLTDMDSSSEEATMIARRPIAAAPPARRAEKRRRRRRGLGVLWPLFAVLGVIAVAVLAAYGAMTFRDESGGTAAEAGNQTIRLSGVGAFDPDGDQSEHDSEAPNATDGDESTYWTTETYRSFSRTKPGVGLVVDAGAVVEPGQITVTTDTPGFTAEIRAGDSPTGPFDQKVSDSKTVEGSTTFDLTGANAQYYVVWITDLDGVAHVNEVTAR